MRGNLARLYIGMPEFVVFFGPGFIHVTSPHGVIGAFHTDRADVDVSHEHGHHQNCGNAMDHIGNLHGAALIDQAGNDFVQHKARSDHHRTQQKHTTPKDDFFACVETVGRNFFSAQYAPALE